MHPYTGRSAASPRQASVAKADPGRSTMYHGTLKATATRTSRSSDHAVGTTGRGNGPRPATSVQRPGGDHSSRRSRRRPGSSPTARGADPGAADCGPRAGRLTRTEPEDLCAQALAVGLTAKPLRVGDRSDLICGNAIWMLACEPAVGVRAEFVRTCGASRRRREGHPFFSAPVVMTGRSWCR